MHNPDSKMRVMQYKVLVNLLDQLQLPYYVYAFEKNRSIPEMAALHVNKHCVISVDIKDFFHSIKQVTLNDIFTRMGIGEKPARTLSELCTYKAFVPQGALTSPKISNIVTSVTFGPEIEEYCRSKDLTLTIYADDVTVSSNDVNLDVGDVLGTLTRIIQSFGFRINRKKTKVMFKGGRQYVCGAVVNAKVNLIVHERKKLRAIVHNISKNGVDSEALKMSKTPSEFLNFVRGRLNWFKQLNPVQGGAYTDKLKTHLQLIKDKATEDAAIALLYKAYQSEAECIIIDDPVVNPIF